MAIYKNRHSSDILLVSVLLLCFTGGKCLTVITSDGEDAVLPCDVGTIDATDLAVEWNREPVLPDDQYVYYWRQGGEAPDGQNPSYVGRTSLFQDEVKKGNVSLKLSRVKSSYEGIYTCHIDEFDKTSTVQLTVVPRPVSVLLGGDVILPCKTNVPVTEATVEWSRKDLSPHYVHVIRNGHEMPGEKNSVYRDRTFVSGQGFKDGDVSLRISGVRPSDQGIYTCFITSEKECVFQITVESIVPDNPPDTIFIIIIIPTFAVLICIIFWFRQRRFQEWWLKNV